MKVKKKTKKKIGNKNNTKDPWKNWTLYSLDLIPYGKFTSTFESKFHYAYITNMNVITPFKPLWHFTFELVKF